MNQQIY